MVQSARWFMDVAEEFFNGMGAQTDDALYKFLEESGGPKGPDLYFVQLAPRLAPNAIRAEELVKRSPYSNPEALRQQLKDAAGRGWLEASKEGEYTPTAKGLEIAKGLFAFADQLYGDFKPLPETDLKQIAQLLSRVVDRAQALPEPAQKPALSWAAKFDRGPSAPPMVQVRRRLLDLFAFRDDAHIAAWQPYETNGQIWETFTYVWRGEASTAAGLAEKLPYRNYDEGTYAAALQELASRGWIASGDDGYVVTKEGKRLRQEAEDATDRDFDAAWADLSEAEMEESEALLKKLAAAVKPAEDHTE